MTSQYLEMENYPFLESPRRPGDLTDMIVHLVLAGLFAPSYNVTGRDYPKFSAKLEALPRTVK